MGRWKDVPRTPASMVMEAARAYDPINTRQDAATVPVSSEDGFRRAIGLIGQRPIPYGTTILITKPFAVRAPLLIPSTCPGLVVRAASKFEMRAVGVVDALFDVRAARVTIEGVDATSDDTDYTANAHGANRFLSFLVRNADADYLTILHCVSYAEQGIIDTESPRQTTIIDYECVTTALSIVPKMVSINSLASVLIGIRTPSSTGGTDPQFEILSSSNLIVACRGGDFDSSGGTGNNRLAGNRFGTKTLHATDVDADDGTPDAHAASHQNGGSDEISVAGLSGLLADAQAPLDHASSHEPGGDDAMTVDAVAATGSLRTLGTGAQQACAGNDSRLSDDRTASGLRSATTVVSVSAATAPTAGQVLTATADNAAEWQDAAGGSGWTTVTKTANENRISTTTLANDATLQFSLAANTKYRVRMVVMAACSSSSPDMKITLAGPSSPTLVAWNVTGIDSAAAAILAVHSAFATTTVINLASSIAATIRIDAVVHNGANAGTLALQWAQNASLAANVTVLAGSYLEYAEVA